MFLRTWDENGNRITQKHAFKPYLYVDSDARREATSIYGGAIRKMEFQNTIDRYDYLTKNNVTRTYENLPPQQQFLIQKFGKVSGNDDFRKHKMRYGFIDIEVEAKEFPEAAQAKFPISLITIYDSKTKKYYVFAFKDVGELNLTKEEDYISDEDVVILAFENERLMLKSFLLMMRKWDFDILAGWNSDIFDIPYLVNRIKKQLGDAEANILSPYFNIRERQAETKFGVPITKYVFDGVSLIDYLDAYKKFNMNIKESYKLDSIAKEEELGVRKLDYGDQSIYDFQTKEWKKFVKYNIIDVHILVLLEEKLQYIALLVELAYFGLCNVEEGLKTVPLVNGVVAIKCREKGYIMPTFHRPERSGKNIGAYVAPPRKGFVKSLITLDATSLYPSTMITLNLSPETKVGVMRELEAGRVSFTKTNGQVLNMKKEDFMKIVKQQNFILTMYGTVFRQDTKGIVPEILEKFMKDRKALKGQMLAFKQKKKDASDASNDALADEFAYKVRFYDTKQNAVKVFMNSIYGYMGNKHAPMGDDDIANSITLTCQYLIKNTGQYAYEWVAENSKTTPEYKDVVIYGDTDSVHISLDAIVKHEGFSVLDENNKVNPRMFEIMSEVRNHINNKNAIWAKDVLGAKDSRFEFKSEKVCYGGLYNEKKKYCLRVLWEEGVDCDEFKYTGLDVVKSTMPSIVKPLAKDVTEEMILQQNHKLSSESVLAARKAFIDMNIQEMSFVTGIKNVPLWSQRAKEANVMYVKGCPWHVKAALAYNKAIKDLGIEGKFEPIASGDKIRIFYVKQPNRYNSKAVAFKGKYPKEFDALFELDTETMYEKAIHAYFGRLYASCGWVLRKHNVQLKNDVLSFLTGGKMSSNTADVEEEEDIVEYATEDLMDGEKYED